MRFASLLLFLLAWSSWCCEATPIRTNFVANAALSSLEVSNIVKLAEECGMSNVVEVSTGYQRPSTNWEIGVKSQEIVNGRRIDYRSLEIHSDASSFLTQQTGPPKPANGLRHFWVDSPVRMEHHEEFTFKTATGEMRVRILGDLPLEIADRIVGSFAAGRIRFADENIRSQVELETLTLPRKFLKPAYPHPIVIGRFPWDNHYSISFSDSLNKYQFDLEGNEVKILSVTHVLI